MEIKMYYTINEFLSDWSSESEKSISLFSKLTDESLKQKVYDEGRTLGYIAWHVVLTIGEMLGQTGLEADCPSDGTPQPETAKEILDAYKKASDSILEVIPKNWKDKNLHDQLNVYGQEWTKEYILTSLVRHEIHHRAQMTVLMRQAGLKIPGLYGPSKEEWGNYGMEAHK